jgi:serine/threonine-protein kinase
MSVKRQIRQYNFTRLLGRGRHGATWLAMDQGLQQPVVVKFVPERLATDPDFLERFEIEQQRLNGLPGKHCARYLGVDTADKQPFIVREYIDGQSLADYVGGQPQFYRDFLELALEISRAVKASHEAAVPIQNLSSHNIVVRDNGQIKLVDCGLPWHPTENHDAHLIEAARYRSPEQLSGQPADHTCDMFSLGTILGELLAGRRFFSGETLSQITRKVNEPHSVLETTPRRLSPEIHLVLNRLWEADRDERLTSSELVASLETMQVFHLREADQEEDEQSWGDPRKFLTVSVLAVLLVILWLAITSAR